MRPIDGLDLDVPAGNLAILLGPSGCGKTTLLSCLGGILSPTSGRISFGDVAITGLDGRSPEQTTGATPSASCSRRSTSFRA